MRFTIYLLFAFFSSMNLSANLFAQLATENDHTQKAQFIYKINPLYFFQTPRSILLGIEKPLQNRLSFVQEIGGGHQNSQHFHQVITFKGITEIRKYFWDTPRIKKHVYRNHYLALDVQYRYTRFEVNEWIRDCVEQDCYQEYYNLNIKNYHLSDHIKYGKQINSPIKRLLLDYYVGLGWKLIIGKSEFSDELANNWQYKSPSLTVANQQKIKPSLIAGIRIGYKTFKRNTNSKIKN